MIEDWDFWKMSMAASMAGDSSISERERLLFRELGVGINMFTWGWLVRRLTGHQEVAVERAVISQFCVCIEIQKMKYGYIFQWVYAEVQHVLVVISLSPSLLSVAMINKR
jgi:hypothetical protein